MPRRGYTAALGAAWSPYARPMPGDTTRAGMSGGIHIGETFAGYRIEATLPRGGMSEVFVAEHLGLGRKVLLKILASELSDDPSFRLRFVRESRIAAGL